MADVRNYTPDEAATFYVSNEKLTRESVGERLDSANLDATAKSLVDKLVAGEITVQQYRDTQYTAATASSTPGTGERWTKALLKAESDNGDAIRILYAPKESQRLTSLYKEAAKRSADMVRQTAQRIGKLQENVVGTPTSEQANLLLSESKLLNEQIRLYKSTANRAGIPPDETIAGITTTLDQANVIRTTIDSSAQAIPASNPDQPQVPSEPEPPKPEPDIPSEPVIDIAVTDPETLRFNQAVEAEVVALFENNLQDALVSVDVILIDTDRAKLTQNPEIKALVDAVKTATPPIQSSKEFAALMEVVNLRLTESQSAYDAEQAEFQEFADLLAQLDSNKMIFTNGVRDTVKENRLHGLQFKLASGKRFDPDKFKADFIGRTKGREKFLTGRLSQTSMTTGKAEIDQREINKSIYDGILYYAKQTQR
ncbi:hypothetical protein KBD71_01145 [Candidatus Woesebacteria bacterium]|nr:hypothetical protein [Candidatus Woesebacteria bacterium]